MSNNDLLLVPTVKKPYVGEGSWLVQVDFFSGGIIDASYGVTSDGIAISYDPRGDKLYGTSGATANVHSAFLLRSVYNTYQSGGSLVVEFLKNELSQYFTPTSVATTVYVHRRKGSKIVSEAFNKEADKVQFFPSSDTALFDEGDLGKKINVYIGPSSTPPPWI